MQQLGCTTSPARTFTLRSLARLHQTHTELRVTTWEKLDLESQIFPLSEAMEKQPRSCQVNSGTFGSTGRTRTMGFLNWQVDQLQHPSFRQATPMYVTSVWPEVIIINSQGCEVLELFEQPLNPAEPTSLTPEPAAGQGVTPWPWDGEITTPITETNWSHTRLTGSCKD